MSKIAGDGERPGHSLITITHTHTKVALVGVFITWKEIKF